MSTFRCTIVTPDAAVFDEDVKYVSFPAWDGQQGVLSHQSPLLTRLGIGPLRLDPQEGSSRWFLVDGGFAQVRAGVLTILTERAQAAEDVSSEEGRAVLKEANEAAVGSGLDRRSVEARQQRGRAMIALASR